MQRSPRGVPFSWRRERYEWQEPDVVTLTQLDSNVARNGITRYTLSPDQAGTRLTCERYREFYGLRGGAAGTVMVLAGAAVLQRQLRKGLHRYDRPSRL